MLNLLLSLIGKLSGKISEVIYNYLVLYKQDWLRENSLLNSAEKLNNQILIYVINISFILIVLMVYIGYKLYNRYIKKNTNDFTKINKKAVAVYLCLIAMQVGLIGYDINTAFVPKKVTSNMMAELQYQPGNQPITDAIVKDVTNNVVPEIVEATKIAKDVLSDPEKASKLMNEFTGIDMVETVEEMIGND